MGDRLIAYRGSAVIGYMLLQAYLFGRTELHCKFLVFFFPSVPIYRLGKTEIGWYWSCSCQILGGWRGKLNQRIKRQEISLSRVLKKVPGDDVSIPTEPLYKLSSGPLLCEDVKTSWRPGVLVSFLLCVNVK